jgi:hypothetical protein
MPNAMLGVRRQPTAVTFDSHGARKQGALMPLSALMPAMIKEQPDGSWLVCLDADLWPVKVQDQASDGVNTWVLTSVHLCENPLDHLADYIRCNAAQRQAAGTEPTSGRPVGSEFIGR